MISIAHPLMGTEEEAARQVLSLPVHPVLSEKDFSIIVREAIA